MSNIKWLLFALGLLMFWSCNCCPCHASEAIAVLVGVDEYQSNDIPDLYGAENDADLLGMRLSDMGFEVWKLPNVTRAEIIHALRKVAQDNKINPLQRFVFAFSGHGGTLSDGNSCLCPSNTSVNDGVIDKSTVVTSDTLDMLLSQINALSRTAILDTCYSGGMGSATEHLSARRHVIRSVTGPARSLPTNVPSVHALPWGRKTSGICYIFACSRWEEAEELDFGSSSHRWYEGAFTKRLVDFLRPGITYEKLLSNVRKYVDRDCGDMQHPTMSLGFRNSPVFDNVPDTRWRTSDVSDIYEAWSAGNDDPDTLRLVTKPSSEVIPLNTDGQRTEVDVDIVVRNDDSSEQSYYLCVLDLDPSGIVSVVYPDAPSPTTNEFDPPLVTVAAGTEDAPSETTVSFQIFASSTGLDHLRAFLFKSRAAALRMLNRCSEIESLLSADSRHAANPSRIEPYQFTSADAYFYVVSQ